MTVDPHLFRGVMGQVPTCVTVVTALVDDQPKAMVIGSFVSVSLAPPLVGFFCTTTSFMWGELKKASTLGVNVLGQDQVSISNACMREPSERFDGLDWEMVDGAPRIADTSAWITLHPHQVIQAGDHEFGLYKVVTMDKPQEPRSPMIYYGGGYRALAEAEPT